MPVLRQMEELNFLSRILPELAEMKGVVQNGYHHLDVFDHSLQAVAQLEKIMAAPETFFKKTAAYVADYAGQVKKPAFVETGRLISRCRQTGHPKFSRRPGTIHLLSSRAGGGGNFQPGGGQAAFFPGRRPHGKPAY